MPVAMRRQRFDIFLDCCDNLPMTVKITFWKEADGRYLGYLNDYPDHWTQGDDLADLREQLRDLFQMFNAEEIPGIRKEEELEVA
jgi:predicted RNase H-like HicB family nuclease